MVRSTAAVLTALCLGPALAANIDPRLAKFDVCGRFEVFHINGIQTAEAEAIRNLRLLASEVGNAHNQHLIAYRLAYNPTQGALLDLVDVFAQKLNEYPGATFATIVRAFLGRPREPLPVSLSDELQRILIERIRDTGYVSLNDADLALVVDRIRRQRANGAKTLLVPHSQGNLYANSAYALLTQAANDPVPAKSLAIVGVASPAAYVAGPNGRYVTSRQDLVIWGLRRLLGGRAVLPGNVTQPISVDDPLGHNFQAIYLRPGTSARTKLLSDVAAAFDALRTVLPDPAGRVTRSIYWIPDVEPYPPWSCPAIPARLTWNDLWSHPGEAAFHERPGPRDAVEPEARSQVRTCYAAVVDAHQRWRLLPPGQPLPDELLRRLRCDQAANTGLDRWNIYSADERVESYREIIPSVGAPNDGRHIGWQRCDNGAIRQYVVYGAMIAQATISGACRRD